MQLEQWIIPLDVGIKIIVMDSDGKKVFDDDVRNLNIKVDFIRKNILFVNVVKKNVIKVWLV